MLSFPTGDKGVTLVSLAPLKSAWAKVQGEVSTERATAGSMTGTASAVSNLDIHVRGRCSVIGDGIDRRFSRRNQNNRVMVQDQQSR